MVESFVSTQCSASANKVGRAFPAGEILEKARKSAEYFGKTKATGMSKEDVEDIASETVVKAWKSWPTYNSTRSKPTTWAQAVAHSCQYDALQRWTKQNSTFTRLESVNDDGDEYIESATELAASTCGADSDLEYREFAQSVNEAINALPESMRFIMHLTMEGMKPRQIAELMGCTPSTVSVSLSKARKRLRKKLTPLVREYGYTL